jgi:hypothetical protein
MPSSLLQLTEQLGALGKPGLQDHLVVLDGLLRLRCSRQRLVVQRLQILHGLLTGDQLSGEHLGGLLVLRGLVTVTVGVRLVGQDQRLTRR